MGAMLPADPWWSCAAILIAMVACQIAGLSGAGKGCSVHVRDHHGDGIQASRRDLRFSAS